MCASRKRGHFRLHNVRDQFTWSLPSSPFGSAALCLLRVWIKPSRERDCSLSPIRPPGGSGAHSQAACSQRSGKDLQKLLRWGNRPGDPRIRNHLQSILSLLREWENCVLTSNQSVSIFTQKLPNLNSLIIILFRTITLISLA